MCVVREAEKDTGFCHVSGKANGCLPTMPVSERKELAYRYGICPERGRRVIVRTRHQNLLIDLILLAAISFFTLIAWLMVVASASAQKVVLTRYQNSQGLYLPDTQVTPGAVRTQSTEELCNPKFRTSKYRHTSLKLKKQVCALYGVKNRCPSRDYEIDHLVSLELGGQDSLQNLWPQPIAQAREKDQLEDRLKVLVCHGEISLSNAQEYLEDNWASSYRVVFGKEPEK